MCIYAVRVHMYICIHIYRKEKKSVFSVPLFGMYIYAPKQTKKVLSVPPRSLSILSNHLLVASVNASRSLG